MVPDAIIFDFDGLIIDTEIVGFRSIDRIFHEHGTSLSYELWQGFLGTVDHPHWTDILAEQLGHPVDAEALIAQRRDADVEALDALPILDGVLELIDAAADAGVPTAVASSSPADWVVTHLQRLGLFDRFGAVCTGDQVERTKPAPDVYLLAASRLGVEPSRCIAIEDAPTGCRAAHAAGMTVVAVPSTMTQDLEFPFAHHVVRSAAELDPQVLGALLAGPSPRPQP